jgi:hypothetical protein
MMHARKKVVERAARSGSLPCALGLLLTGAGAQGAEDSSLVTLGVGAEYSDNIRREAQDEESETIATVSFGTDLRRTSTRLDLGFNADLAYDYYTGDTYDPELRGNAQLNFEGQIVRQRLSWYVDDSFGQLRLEALAPETPDNREQFNVFTTGPRFTQPFGSRTRLVLAGLYEIETYEISPTDLTRTGADLSLRRDLSPSQYLEVTAATRETKYEEEGLFDDYDIDEYYLTWSITGAKTTLTLSGGETRLQFPDREDDSLLLKVDAERQVGAHGTLVLNARSQKATTADAFRTEQSTGTLNLNTQPFTAVGQPFDFEYLALGYELTGRRLSGSLSGSVEEDRYDTATENDRDRKSLNASVDWVVSPTWSCGAGVEYARENYIVTGQRFKELGLLLDARARLSRTLNLTFQAVSWDRSGAVGTNAYDETRLRVMVSWSGGQAR